MGVKTGGMSVEGVRAAVDAVKPLAEHPHPQRLHELGVRESGYSGAGGGCVQRCLHGRQSRPTSVEEIERLYHIAY